MASSSGDGHAHGAVTGPSAWSGASAAPPTVSDLGEVSPRFRGDRRCFQANAIAADTAEATRSVRPSRRLSPLRWRSPPPSCQSFRGQALVWRGTRLTCLRRHCERPAVTAYATETTAWPEIRPSGSGRTVAGVNIRRFAPPDSSAGRPVAVALFVGPAIVPGPTSRFLERQYNDHRVQTTHDLLHVIPPQLAHPVRRHIGGAVMHETRR